MEHWKRSLDHWLTTEPEPEAEECEGCGELFKQTPEEINGVWLCRDCFDNYWRLECPACGCSNDPTGMLGEMHHYRCRACGIWYNHPEEEVG